MIKTMIKTRLVRITMYLPDVFQALGRLTFFRFKIALGRLTLLLV